MIEIYKFGGASINSAERIQNVANIIKANKSDCLVLVVSAAGKMTNAFEKLLVKGNNIKQLDEIESYHQLIINELQIFNSKFNISIQSFIDQLNQLLETTKNESYNYRYDQIVSFGELISTTIVSEYLRKEGIDIQWLDARDLIQTDSTYREGKVNWKSSSVSITQQIQCDHSKKVYLTQGFISRGDSGNTTTLGREGSDFTAAVLGFCLNANSVTIWKDVPGVLNADPRLFHKPKLINHLSYKEAIEMTYYGAQVIHPKTIKPLQNKGIPLHVRSFLDLNNEGTKINDQLPGFIPPIKVVKHQQCLWQISTRDFAFIIEDHLSAIYKLFAEHSVKINVIQNTAISLSICLDHDPRKIKPLFDALESEFDISEINDLELLTIRHYSNELVDQIIANQDVLLEERIQDTCRLVILGKVTTS